MKTLQVDSHTVLLDDEDYTRCANEKWYVTTKGYIANPHTGQWLHKFVLNYTGPLDVDHWDHNKLNNQKYNLRIITRSGNALNRTAPSGVRFKRDRNKWQARIKVDYQERHLGYFDSKDAAEQAVAIARAEAIQNALI